MTDVSDPDPSRHGLPLSETELLRAVVGAAPVVAFAIDRAGRLAFRSGGGALLDPAAIGRPVAEVWPSLQDKVEQALAGEVLRFDVPVAGHVFDTTYLPVRDEQGHEVGVVGLGWDVTRERQLALRTRRKADALIALSDRENQAGMDLTALLDAIARTAAEQLGTWAYATLLATDNRSFEVSGGWHPDPEIDTALRGVRGARVSVETSGFAAVLEHARALSVGPDNQDNRDLRALAPPPLDDFMTRRPAIAIAHAPLLSRGRPIGVLSVHRSIGHPGGDFEPDDLALLEDLGQRAGLHVQVLTMFRRRVDAEVRALRHAGRQAALADLARTAMGPGSLHDILEAAAEAVSTQLGGCPVSVVALDPEHGPTPRAGRGSPASSAEPREMTCPIEGPDGPWGLFTVSSDEVSDPDVASFVEAACNILGTAVLQRMTTAQLQHQALHDSLTGLPNRALLQDRLHVALAHCSPGTEVVLLLMDLDRFKTVNDSAGHTVGDHLLQAVARRLRAAFPAHTVGRLGGDEFALVAEVGDSSTGPHVVAAAVVESFRDPFALPSGHELYVSAAIGMSVARHGDGKDVTGMLREADAAMYSAKRRGGYRVFDERLRRAADAKLDTETSLRRAMARGDFHLLYQPLVAAADEQPAAVEALLRWNRDGRVVAPAHFIPTAEETGLILDIGRWVLRQACEDMVAWHRECEAPCRGLAVNASVRELQTETYADDVLGLLSATGLSPDMLTIEVTESMLTDNLQVSHRNLRRLRASGVHVAVDDFGTGYSSLGQLTQLPVDVLKIDRSFVEQLDDPGNLAIVTAIVTVGRALDLTLVAEGVERPDQAERLRDLGCNLLQGFHYANPLPAEEIGRWRFSRGGSDAAPA